MYISTFYFYTKPDTGAQTTYNERVQFQGLHLPNVQLAKIVNPGTYPDTQSFLPVALCDKLRVKFKARRGNSLHIQRDISFNDHVHNT